MTRRAFTRVIDVPGWFRSDRAYLDLEMRKVPAPPGFRMKNGVPLARRWSAFLAGVSSFQRIRIVESTGDETGFLRETREAIEFPVVVYRANRRIDEQILKGTFTYARRSAEDVPYFPAMPGAEDLEWIRLSAATPPGRGARTGSALKAIKAGRGPDCASIDVPGLWPSDPALVRVHLLRDVVELVLLDGEPDEECAAWCRQVLSDYDFALLQVESAKLSR